MPLGKCLQNKDSYGARGAKTKVSCRESRVRNDWGGLKTRRGRGVKYVCLVSALAVQNRTPTRSSKKPAHVSVHASVRDLNLTFV